MGRSIAALESELSAYSDGLNEWQERAEKAEVEIERLQEVIHDQEEYYLTGYSNYLTNGLLKIIKEHAEKFFEDSTFKNLKSEVEIERLRKEHDIAVKGWNAITSELSIVLQTCGNSNANHS